MSEYDPEKPACKICLLDFSEPDHLPKVLSCGHSLCSKCLPKIFCTTVQCPQCRAPIVVSDCSKVPTNFAILRMLKNGDETKQKNLAELLERIDTLCEKIQQRKENCEKARGPEKVMKIYNDQIFQLKEMKLTVREASEGLRNSASSDSLDSIIFNTCLLSKIGRTILEALKSPELIVDLASHEFADVLLDGNSMYVKHTDAMWSQMTVSFPKVFIGSRKSKPYPNIGKPIEHNKLSPYIRNIYLGFGRDFRLEIKLNEHPMSHKVRESFFSCSTAKLFVGQKLRSYKRINLEGESFCIGSGTDKTPVAECGVQNIKIGSVVVSNDLNSMEMKIYESDWPGHRSKNVVGQIVGGRAHLKALRRASLFQTNLVVTEIGCVADLNEKPFVGKLTKSAKRRMKKKNQ